MTLHWSTECKGNKSLNQNSETHLGLVSGPILFHLLKTLSQGHKALSSQGGNLINGIPRWATIKPSGRAWFDSCQFYSTLIFFRVPKPEICQLDQLPKMEIQIRDNKGNSFRNGLRKRLIQADPCTSPGHLLGYPNWSSIAERSMSIGTPKLSALVPCQIPSFSTKMEEGYLGTTLNLSGNCIYKSFPVTSNLRLPAIFWMWNNFIYGTLDLTKQKKNLQHFYHLDRPVTTCNLFFQGTRCKTWETYTAERFTNPWAGGGGIIPRRK